MIKKTRKLVITASDKGLGPAIMEIDTYIERALNDHLNNPINYKEIYNDEASLINETNYRWVCERFIDYREKGAVSDMEKLFFERSICGIRDDDGVIEMKTSLQLPYFYILPKVHKTPWATRPVVSGVSSILEPLSKWVDIHLQRVVHLCPAYLKDSCDKILESLVTGTNTNAIRYLTKTGSCSRASFSRPQQSPSLRSIAAQIR
jgi:hypothetical protein